MDEQYVVPQYVVPDDGVSRQSAADLLHQFALVALPEIEQGIRAEKETGQ